VPNILKVAVENADELLNSGAYDTGAVIRLQSATSEGGAYSNLTGTGSTPTLALVAGTRAYTGYDPNGTSTTYYRTRYENAGATRVSDWSAEFQVAAEGSGLLCSLYNAKQRLGIDYTDTSEDENLLGYIAQASRWIEGRTGRWFTPRDDTLQLSVNQACRTVYVPRGIRAITTLSYATTDQADSGGTYTAITTYSLQPGEIARDAGWPATRVTLLSTSAAYFWPGLNTVKIIGSFGWSEVPPDIERVALNLVVADHRSRASTGDTDAFTIGIDGRRAYSRTVDANDWSTLRFYSERPT